MSCTLYEEMAIFMFYNFMNIPNWISWKIKEVSGSLSVPRRAPYGVTIAVYTVH